MNQLLAIFGLIRQLLPLIKEGVDLMDAAMPAGTPGKQKLDTLQTWLKQATDADVHLSHLFDSAWPLISVLVSAIVSARKTITAPAAP